MNNSKENILKRLGMYIYERFNLLAYSIFIIAMFFSAVSLAKSSFSILLLPALLVLFLYFLRLRMYDDLKDHQIDIDLKPHRPLPRGLVTRKEIITATHLLIVLEIIVVYILNVKLIIPYLLIILFSLLTFHEFFIGKTLRKNILLYALPHVLLMFFIGAFLYYSIIIMSLLQFKLTIFLIFGFICYILGLIFEISRKMPPLKENKSSNESFISLLGFEAAWITLIALFALSSLITAYLFRAFILSLAPSFAFILFFLFKRNFIKDLSQKGAQLLGSLCILYVFLSLIFGGLLING